MKLKRIVIVQEPASLSAPEAFFSLEGYRLVNDYGDGQRSPEYRCESVHRRGTDGVAALVYRRPQAKRRLADVEILLKECIRPPVFVRDERVGAERKNPPLLLEVVAGSREPYDKTTKDLRNRMALEIDEEAGIRVKPARVKKLGPPVFTSPGGLSEEVHLYSVDATGLKQEPIRLDDAHPLERHSTLHWVPLAQALKWLDQGKIADAKTEILIRRFAAGFKSGR